MTEQMTKRNGSPTHVWRPHVVVGCVVARGDRYLMVEEMIDGHIVYNHPAGHLEDGESLQEAAVRETREETGWTVALTHLLGVHQWRSKESGDVMVHFSFAAKPLSHDSQQPLDAGIRRTMWLTRNEIADLDQRLRSPMILMSVDEWLAGQRLPLVVVANLMPGGKQ
jgi:ADP-ribose pyrophosphatase YjhB (NUDIX family)